MRFFSFFSEKLSIFVNGIKNMMIMANTSTIPTQGQIIVNIEDMSMLKDIKKAISMVKGVGKITVPRRKQLTNYERSLRDIEEGRVNEYASVDDFFKSMGI
jgi:hypothetical protein